MIVTVSVVSIIAYGAALVAFHKRWLQQQIAFLIIYLAGLTIIGELDVLLPIYFIVSLLPFLGYIRKLSIPTVLILIYFCLYLIYGLVCQDVTGTIVTFVAKMWQFVVFFVVYDADIPMSDTDDCGKLIWMAVITETLLGFYLLATSTNVDANGLIRLVSNAQPITGNISTVVLPISVYYYLVNRTNARKTGWLLIANAIMLIWIVLSGTRGYTLEFAATMILVFYDYFTNRKVEKTSHLNRMVTIVMLGMGAVLCVVVIPGILEKLESVLRLKSSVGIRTYENAAVQEFMHNAPLATLLFGIGLGGQGGSYEAMKVALYRQRSLGMWNVDHYLNASGALFHNLYANILMCLGLFGAIVMILINISIWRRVTYSCRNHIWIRRIMHLFQLSFLLMNYYRWSAVCGICEMIIFALILKLLGEKEKDNVLTYQTV